MKRFFSKHAKSSALVVTLAIHAALIIVAVGFVAFKVFIPTEVSFRDVQVTRDKPRMPIHFKPFQTADKRPPKPVIKPTPVRITSVKTADMTIPQVAMINIPMVGNRNDDNSGLQVGFDTTFDFFESTAKGEKVCFIVHFGPATIGKTPYSRMTGYTIRKRLEDIVDRLPEYALFNVACYWAADTCAISPKMMLANASNKEKVLDWMEPVNPLEGSYDHCFSWRQAGIRVGAARSRWPTRVAQLPSYSPKWVYPYSVPADKEQKYLGAEKGFMHWGRAVAWSILTQKPDTIFVLTTNYIDGWGGGNNGEPTKMVAGYKKMMLDVYGPDKKTWPTLNVVVLAHAGKGSSGAYKVLNEQFGPLVKSFKGDGSVIEDISKYMNDDEKELLRKYAGEQ